MRLPSQDDIIYCDVKSNMGAEACTHLSSQTAPSNSTQEFEKFVTSQICLSYRPLYKAYAEIALAIQFCFATKSGLQEVYTAVGTATHKVAELYKKPEDVQAQNLVLISSDIFWV